MSIKINNTLKPVIPPYLGIAGGILAVSTSSIIIRFAQDSAPSLVIATYRLVFATLILSPWALTRSRREIVALNRKDVLLSLLSGVFLALHFAAWITSLSMTTVASSVVLVTTSSLWVSLLSPWVLKERISKTILVGLFIALAGGTIVSLSDVCQFTIHGLSCAPAGNPLELKALSGNFLALFGAWMAAGYLLIGRQLRVRMSLVAYTFVVYGFAALVLIMITLSLGYSFFGYSPLTFLLFLALAVVPQLLGHSTFNWALRYLPAVYVSISLLGEPVGSTILALFIFNEIPTSLKITGGILILIGILISSNPRSSRT